jgi:signal transduction histidine kinase
MTIRTKISLVFTLMTGAILLLLIGCVYILSIQHAHTIFFTRLKVRASLAAESHFGVTEINSSVVKEIRERHLQRLPRETEYFMYADSLHIDNIQQRIPHISESFARELKQNGFAEYNHGFLHFSGITYTSATGRNFVIASAYDEIAENHITFLRNVLLLGFLASCLLIFALGRVFASRIMLPISAIVSKVHDITTSNLSERLASGDGNDELSEIANTFNSMLDRLETTFELQRNFISNASHELRTPLTSILGEAEVIQQAPRTTEDYVKSIGIMYHEALKLEEVTSSLLRLSQISYEGKKQKIEPLQLDELLMSIKINFDKRMPGNQVKIMVQPADENPDIYTFMCSDVWMELALTNIIQNSIKYSDNKEVLVTLSFNNEDLFINISDYGIGIPEKDLEHIYEPFFRASNTSKYTGYGIGLPLASRIIRLHGGKMKVHSRPNEGTKVFIQFPQNMRLRAD